MTDTYDGISPKAAPPKAPGNRLGKRPRKPPPLYLRAWITRLGLSQRHVARGVPINEGFLSNILSGKKHPSVGMLHDISRFLGIPEATLRQPPPPNGKAR